MRVPEPTSFRGTRNEYMSPRTRLGDAPHPSNLPPPKIPSLVEDPRDRAQQPRARGTSNPFVRMQERPRFHAAGFFRRLLGATIDLAILFPIVVLLGWLAGMATGIDLPAARHHSVDFWLDLLLALDPALAGLAILFSTVFVAYAAVFFTTLGRTPGMMAMRLRVIDVYGDPPTLGRSLLRAVSYFASVATLGLGFLWIGFDAERRGLHDHLSGTHVVKVK